RKRARCSGLQLYRIGQGVPPNPRSSRASPTRQRAVCSRTTRLPSAPRPPPPSSAGTAAAQKPISLTLASRCACTSGGISVGSGRFFSSGTSSRSVKRLAVSRTNFSSSDSSKSITLLQPQAGGESRGGGAHLVLAGHAVDRQVMRAAGEPAGHRNEARQKESGQVE